NVASLLQRAARSDSRTTVLGGLHYKDGERHAADDAIANRKILWRGEGAERELGYQRTAKVENLICQPRVLARVHFVNARAKNRNRFSLCGHRAAMCRTVHTAGKSTEDDHPSCRQIARQPFRHS